MQRSRGIFLKPPTVRTFLVDVGKINKFGFKKIKDKRVVYASPPRIETRDNKTELPVLADPALLKVAREIYRTYYEAHPKLVQRPTGVAINRITYRGKLIFAHKPILLPQECFIPFSQVESELY